MSSHSSAASLTHWLGSSKQQVPFGAIWNWLFSNMGKLLDSSHIGQP